MTGMKCNAGTKPRIILAIVASVALMGCDEDGGFSLGSGADESATQGANRAAPVRSNSTEQDVERPDIFEVTDRGLWDGRPSLGGVWVAHPDVADPERVIIRNPATGESVIGALFRRERENPGPPLQISSDAAEALSILAGAPTEVSVVVLRREEVTEPEPEDVNPVTAGLDAPISVEQTPLDTSDAPDPVAGAAAAIAAAELAAASEDAAVATPAETPVSDTAAPAPQPAELSGPMVQIGVFSVQANADGAAQTLRDADIPTQVVPEQAGGRTVWRVVSGPAADSDGQTEMLEQIRALGFVDAFGFEG